MALEILFLGESSCSQQLLLFLFSFRGESNSAPKVCCPLLLTFRLQWPSIVNKEQLFGPLGAGKPGQGTCNYIHSLTRSTGVKGPLVKTWIEKGLCFGTCLGFGGSSPPAVCSKHVRYHDSLKPRCRIQPRHLLDAALGEVLSP